MSSLSLKDIFIFPPEPEAGTFKSIRDLLTKYKNEWVKIRLSKLYARLCQVERDVYHVKVVWDMTDEKEQRARVGVMECNGILGRLLHLDVTKLLKSRQLKDKEVGEDRAELRQLLDLFVNEAKEFLKKK